MERNGKERRQESRIKNQKWLVTERWNDTEDERHSSSTKKLFATKLAIITNKVYMNLG